MVTDPTLTKHIAEEVRIQLADSAPLNPEELDWARVIAESARVLMYQPRHVSRVQALRYAARLLLGAAEESLRERGHVQ